MKIDKNDRFFIQIIFRNLMKIFWPLLKIIFCVLIILYLVENKTLDFSLLLVLQDNKIILLFAVFVWLFSVVLLGGIRWKVLLENKKISIRLRDISRLNMIGMMFSSFIPGIVSGDVVKAHYLRKIYNKVSLPYSLSSVIIDRVMGLYSLFCLSFIALFFNFDLLSSKLGVVLWFFLFVFFGLSLFVGILCFAHKIYDFFSLKNISYFKFLQYVPARLSIIKAIFLGVIAQTLTLIYIIMLTKVVSQQDFNWIEVAVAFPLGMLATSLPLTPGGLGVGHVAFEKLYDIIGISNGANIFNVFILVQLSLNLLGIIPFVLWKNKEIEV
jgi:glycosyltransferase 2 family protein